MHNFVEYYYALLETTREGGGKRWVGWAGKTGGTEGKEPFFLTQKSDSDRLPSCIQKPVEKNNIVLALRIGKGSCCLLLFLD